MREIVAPQTGRDNKIFSRIFPLKKYFPKQQNKAKKSGSYLLALLHSFPISICIKYRYLSLTSLRSLNVIIQYKPQRMPITQFKENIVQDSSVFQSNSFTPKVYMKNRVLGKLRSFEIEKKWLEDRSGSTAKAEKKHNSLDKVSRRTLQLLRIEAIENKKNLMLKSQASFMNPESGSTINKSQNTTFDSENQNEPICEEYKQEIAKKGDEGQTKNILENSKKQNYGSPKTNDKSFRKMKEYKILHFSGKAEVFQVVKYIDSGSFGDVFLVKHIITKMIFCLKSIRKCLYNENNLNQLARQIKIQSSLNHPNIIKVYGYTADQEYIYILMEPCLGKNLFKIMNGQPLSESLVRSYLQQVCQAVAYLHGQDIIHRDIKPENILVDGDVVKICDFGWAVYAPLLRSTRCGTPIYTPPEMIRMEEYDNKVDIWCIGMLTYELLYATIPFQIQSLNDLPKIANDQIVFPLVAHISHEAETFIRSCLKKTSEERYSIKQALEHDFLHKRRSQFRHTFP